MTDKLKETVEHAIQELKEVVATLNARRVWRGTCWEYPPILPEQYLPLRNTIHWQVSYLRSALAEWTPDDTAYRPDGLSQEKLPPVKSYCGGKPNYCEPEMLIDRGAWSDVPDASKWVDKLRGDNNQYQRPETYNMKDCSTCGYPLLPEERTDLVEINGKMSKPWANLTDDDMEAMFLNDDGVRIARYIESKLKEKNNG